MRDFNNFFTAEDFVFDTENTDYRTWLTPNKASYIANAFIREELKKAKRVYGTIHSEFGAVNFSEHKALDNSHAALLICEEEIK